MVTISVRTPARIATVLGYVLGLRVLTGCQPPGPGPVQPLFTPVSAARTGIGFENTLRESAERNVLNYEYLYNGGGVAAGDFNNDGLCDLYFTGNAVENKLYLNRGGLRFEDVTRQAGAAGRQKWKTGVTAADVNGDGWLDLYVCHSGPVPRHELRNELYLNQGCPPGGVPTFAERAAAYGLDAPYTFSTHASFFDYDRDGDLDMFLLNHATRFFSPFINTRKLRATRHPQFGNRLYRNEGDGFTEVSDAAGIRGSGLNFGLSVSVSDVNGDGWPDVYVTNDYEEQDFFYLNGGNGTFAECAEQSFGHISRFGMGSDIADINNDARPDIVVMDMLPEDNHRQKMLKGPDLYSKYQLMADSGYHRQQMRNTLQLNQGTRPGNVPVFSEIGQLAGVSATDWSWAPLLADYDNDGYKDLFVTNGYLRDFTNLDFLKYTVEEARAEARKTGTELQVYALIGKMPSTKISNYLFRNEGGLRFSNQTSGWGLDHPGTSFGAAYADLDNDGDLDLVVNNTNETAGIWENHARERPASNFLTIKLQGAGRNPFGVGARVFVASGAQRQVQEVMPSRGYQSSVPPVLHFGLGKDRLVQRVTVAWPDGRRTVRENVPANAVLTLRHDEPAGELPHPAAGTAGSLFRDVSATAGADFRHRENDYVDFHHEPLIPYQVSRLGPSLAAGDADGDGLGDFYVGGAAGQAGRLYLMQPDGRFAQATGQPWAQDAPCEDQGTVFFDAEGDGDLDLYVVSGGSEFPPGSPLLQDRLYLNGGKGRFSKAPPGVLPAESASGSCVAAADYDRDGDTDLFVGGRSVPGAYPLPARGGILRNDSDRRTGKVAFTVATPAVNASLRETGIVTDARWTDFNGDGWPDLLLVGEWMPVLLFENRHGKLMRVEDPSLAATGGWWTAVHGNDFDGDGDTDYVLGNLGANSPWRASPGEPLALCYGDFDENGRVDPIICNYVQGKSYPVASRDELLEQIPALRKKYVKYIHYADQQLEDILSPEQLQKAVRREVHTLQSSYLENLGSGRFRLRPLPPEAQYSVVQGLASGDYDGDGHLDLLLAGNFYPFRVQQGPFDAGHGLLLRGNGKGGFVPVPWTESGFYAAGDVRDLVSLPGPGGVPTVVLAKNDANVQVIALTGKSNQR